MIVHLVAGGTAGTVGSILTCPLEVIKTRFQASSSSYERLLCKNTGDFNNAHNGSNLYKQRSNRFYNQSHHQHHHTFTLNTNFLIRNATNAKNVLAANLNLVDTSPQFNSNTNSHHHSNTASSSTTAATSAASSSSTSTATTSKSTSMANSTSKHSLRPSSTMTTSKLIMNDLVDKNAAKKHQRRIGTGIYLHLRFIVEHEGYRALFKGILPNIIGVAPYRAIYFYSYAHAKQALMSVAGENKNLLHICSAYLAGFTAVSITNPIWFIKTRLQLDETRRGLSVTDVIKRIYKTKGLLGFYKGVSASYFGITETALYFVIYEQLRAYHMSSSSTSSSSSSSSSNEHIKYLNLFISAGFAKTLASCLCYPHEVARTRLRQEGNKYNGFFQTLGLVLKEEGMRGLYKGMATHFIRQIPNTAIVMTTYELLLRYLA